MYPSKKIVKFSRVEEFIIQSAGLRINTGFYKENKFFDFICERQKSK